LAEHECYEYESLLWINKALGIVQGRGMQCLGIQHLISNWCTQR